MLVITTVIAALLQSLLASQEVEAIAISDLKGQQLGCRGARPTCNQPIVHFQNYQDVNVDVDEYYNFISSFPAIEPAEAYGWTLEQDSASSYNNGLFLSSNGTVSITKNSVVDLSVHEAQYISAQIEFNSTATGVVSPLGWESDPFYGAGFFTVSDRNVTGLEYGFILTNNVVYAWYGRDVALQTPSYNFIAFNYLVPIAARQPNAIYTFIFSNRDATVSWMIDGIVKFAIPVSEKLIDDRFLLTQLTGDWPIPSFPANVTVQLGIARLAESTANTACQDTLFNYCDRTQNIFDAINTVCVYEPIQDPTTYAIDMEMYVSLFSLVDANSMKPACSCPFATSK